MDANIKGTHMTARNTVWLVYQEFHGYDGKIEEEVAFVTDNKDEAHALSGRDSGRYRVEEHSFETNQENH